MNNEEQAVQTADRKTSWLKKLGIRVIVLAVVFLLGYVPSYWKARSVERERARLEQQFNLARLHSHLGMASFEANRNNYFNATDYANKFFNGLKTAINSVGDAALKERLQTVSASRDKITASLAKADPAVKETIAQLYADFYQFR
jgi:hypothetical protein